ncbi:type IV toxin-antitoxin system AbiEi family antitoxin [Enterobacter sp.]|uniref:type IV toxin-antitoxin system AbiEi family antitoxin n=1 Tax=Enterobacter sp. TaxID=42895 RepID=UPI00296F3E9C|nr:type IV toxin-antitoxin system AbiEi family antitoxin domain-containing protein [Enterobacter sp.]
MNRSTALQKFTEWDKQRRYVFTLADLSKIFSEDSPKTLQAGLNRLVKEGILIRPVRGVYLFNLAHSRDSYTIEHIARALRRGEYNYVSLESALSEYGVISQIPIDRLTVMTTGRKGTYHTPFGTIEFTHTKRQQQDILAAVVQTNRPLKIATPECALRDLKRVGRNVHLVNEKALLNDE